MSIAAGGIRTWLAFSGGIWTRVYVSGRHSDTSGILGPFFAIIESLSVPIPPENAVIVQKLPENVVVVQKPPENATAVRK